MTTALSLVLAFALLIGVAMLLHRPMWAFLLIAVFYPLEQLLQAYFDFLVNRPAFFNYVVAAIAVLAIAMRAAKRELIGSGMNTAAVYLILAQFGLWLVGMLYSPVRDVAFEVLRTYYPYILLFLVVMPFLIVDLREFHKILIGTMVVGAVIAVMVLLNPKTTYYAGRLMLDLGMVGARTHYGSPLATAEMGGMVALIAALIVPARYSMPMLLLRITAFVLGLGLAVGSGSRGQVLATVVAGICAYPLARRLNSPSRFLISTFGLLALTGVMYITFQAFIGDQNRLRWDPVLMIRDIGMRFDMVWLYTAAWISSPAHWLFGLGTNYWVIISPESGIEGNYVHNIAAEILCEQGLVGAGIFIATVILTIRAGVRMWSQYGDDPVLRSTAAILMAICAYSLFNSLKQGSLVGVAPFFWFLVLAKISEHERRHAIVVDEVDADVLPEAGQFGTIEYGHPGYAIAR